MSKHLFCFLATAVMASTPVFVAASNSDSADAGALAFEAWFRTRSEQGAERRLDEIQRGALPTQGVHRILSVAEIDAPARVKNYILEGISKQNMGTLHVEAGVLPSEADLTRQLPRHLNDSDTVQRRVSLPFSNLTRTSLAHAQLLAVQEAGARGSDGATGVARYFRLPDIGLIELVEEDYHAPGTVIETYREALNSEINGTPAMLRMTRGADGRGSVALTWITSLKSYALQLTTDHAEHLDDHVQVLRDIALAIRD